MNYAQVYQLHFEEYQQEFEKTLENFTPVDIADEKQKEYLQNASAVFSANIEGNTLDLNLFFNAKYFAKKFPQKKEEQEIESLIEAYQFAQTGQYKRFSKDNSY